MLEKNRFLAIKNLAKDIREENEKNFLMFEEEDLEKAIKEKEKFVKSIIESMEIAFSDGKQGKEERQVFRANILIPNDLDFFEAYSKDKNIRMLMNKYAVSLEDIMNKITELNIYGKYMNSLDPEEQEDFVDEMVNMSTAEAESLLDEIENLSKSLDKIDIEDEEDIIEPVILKTEEELTDVAKEDNFDEISDVVNNFVDGYSKMQSELKNIKEENDSLKTKLSDKEKEVEDLEKAFTKTEDTLKAVDKENKELKNQLKSLEDKLFKMTDVIKKIYNTIPKK